MECTLVCGTTVTAVLVVVSHRAVGDIAPSCLAGVDERLARHIAHLWIRDPLVIFSERVVVDDTRTSEHFEVHNHVLAFRHPAQRGFEHQGLL